MAIENLQPLAYAIATIAFALGTCSIFLRLYCRWRLQTFGWDDGMAVLLFFVNGVQHAIVYIFLYNGSGRHVAELPDGQLQKVTKWLFIEEIYWMFLHWVIKQAFLLFYLRLSPQRGFQIAVYITMGINTSFTIINCMLGFMQCRPMDAMIHPELYPNAQCLSQYVVMMVPTALNAFSDIIILVLPIPTVLKLRMSSRRKLAVLGVIGFGSLSVITAMCRFALQVQMVENPDTTYVLGRMLIAASIEIEVAVIAVNLPALKTLFTKFVGGSTADNSVSDGHKMSDYKVSANKYSKGSTTLCASQKESKVRKDLGATLTGSEEDLLRMGGGGEITVTTNIDVCETQVSDGVSGYPDIGFPKSQNSRSDIHPSP
ncbi:uncharacterized protein EURHEDRAFT_373853 [Aspergillus ruber CBS 135680]|uniref:Rhodopsin domain-containing protein n=1 Tax=Aspergillus ruber (strain CBS 135680) TaxID=1388766 RepID=A0A017SR54_ASPRC|nr:uncharacterized protein EURHEDRAFT_373853 [Aspergillus ruber CBS 135680]EYE98765.1 hypothetical protein EURHEDRAFT_373853 [Aspergillus ruber CBS 135680]